MAGHTILIGELSRRTGCNIETIRYYERIGILPAPPRRGRYRSYEDGHVRTLGFVRRSRALGFTLDEVRTLLALACGGQSSCVEARAIAAAHLDEVRKRIGDLKRMERVLGGAVAACDAGNNTGCPLIDSLGGAAAAVSPAPRRPSASTATPRAGERAPRARLAAAT